MFTAPVPGIPILSGDNKNCCSWGNEGWVVGTGEILKEELEACDWGERAAIAADAAAIAAAEGWEVLELLPLPDNVTVLSASISMPN